MSSNSMKRLWQEYGNLKRWTESEKLNKIFEIQSCSLDNGDDDTASASTNGFFTIKALIYPRSEPFGKQPLKIEIQVPHTYPFEPPKFVLKIQLSHPNVTPNGQICSVFFDIDKLYEPQSLSDLIKRIVDILDKPEIGYFFDDKAGNLYQSDPDKYNESIREAVSRNRPR